VSIKQHFAEIDAEHRESRCTATAKQRKIDAGELLDVERDPVSTVDPYLGDSIENLTDSSLNVRETYGANSTGSSRKTASAKASPWRCHICKTPVSPNTKTRFCRLHANEQRTKEAKPRKVRVSARVTRETHRQLAAFRRESKFNPSDVFMMFAGLYAAAQNGNKLAKWALRIIKTYSPHRKRNVGELDPVEHKNSYR
jgi:hypothetical protein